ncbi:sodium:proton antiporter [Bdellovibrio sp. ArHS]|uniref:sodium:proton antiporter n=1 Tax=Bdellovibrio sp. ArHS TaxID=1569284 RepID=UPI0025BD8FAA|nr:sodium:proton antiporter [Bdellovibrio sp. ArHS]
MIIALLFAASMWLVLSKDWLRLIIGISLLGHATNLYILKSGSRTDILPQALILTAIVIGLAIQTVLLVFAYFAQRSEKLTDLDEMKEDE